MITRWTLRDNENRIVVTADSTEAVIEAAGNGVQVSYENPFSRVIYWTGEGWTMTINEVEE
jgi:hypothetical protein